MTAPRITIIDYGVGNLLSIRRAVEQVGGEAILATDPDQVASAERLLLPGVGAFAHCAENLAKGGLVEPAQAFVATGRPFLGICVGMQLMLDRSSEFGETPGLGLIAGAVDVIPPCDALGSRKVPHIGWAPLAVPTGGRAWQSTPLSALKSGADWAYFVHSFSVRPDDPSDILAEVDYRGFPVCAAVARDNVVGVQFHPEKSGAVGLSVIRQFLD